MNNLREHIEEMQMVISEFIELLRYARNYKTPNFFTWEERMWIHQYNALIFRTIEKLEDYDLGEVPTGAVLAIIDTAKEELGNCPDNLSNKITDITRWMQIKSN